MRRRTRRKIIYSIIFVFIAITTSLALLISRVFVYDTNIAHPGLTKLAAELYNRQTSRIKLTDQEINWLTEGAIEEDTPLRWFNHFYDPIYNQGFNGSFDSAKKWATDIDGQTSYSQGNQTWQEANYQFQKGDKEKAFVALGHVLHLLEDMTVPAHTRDDAHPEGDPYEMWVKDNFQAVSASPIYFDSLNQYFDYLANYSHNNFYSKDTLSSNKFFQPNISKGDRLGDFIYYNDGSNRYKLVVVVTSKLNLQELYRVESPEVNQDYYSLLAPKAIGAGAGAIKLFFEEVQKQQAYQPPTWQINPLGIIQQGGAETVAQVGEIARNVSQSVSGLWQATKDLIWNFGNVSARWNFVNELASVDVVLADEIRNLGNASQIMTSDVPARLLVETTQAITNLDSRADSAGGNDNEVIVLPVFFPSATANVTPSIGGMNQVASLSEETNPDLSQGFLTQPTVTRTDTKQNTTIGVSSGNSSYSSSYSSGGSVSVSQSQPESPPLSSPPAPETPPPPPPPPPPPDTTPPDAPVILEPAISTVWATSTSATLFGSVSSDTFGLTINNEQINASSTFWQAVVNLVEGENIFAIIASDMAGNVSATSSVRIFKDTSAPAPTIQFARNKEQGTIIEVTWSGDDGAGSGVASYDVAYHAKEIGAASSTDWIAWQSAVTSTAGQLTVEMGKAYQFRIRAMDKLDNASDWVVSLWQEIALPKIVINEIAWGGTKASANDEWMELYNTADYGFDVSGWRLTDGNDINFVFATGTRMATRAFFLLERTSDQTIANIAMDAKYTGALYNGGEKLQLKDMKGHLIDEVNASAGWFAGRAGYDMETMERIDPSASGNLAGNWQSTPLPPRNGFDANGNAISGTPKRPNSPFIYLNGVLNRDRIILPDNNPYFLGNYTVASGTTLTFSAGVVVKAGLPGGNGGNLLVYGTIASQGTTDLPIVFTSYRDSSYSGNTNTWDSSQTPAGSDWRRLYFYPGSRADLSQTKILYGNFRSLVNDPNGALVAEGAEISAAAVTVSQARVGEMAVNLTNASSSFSNCLVSKNSTGVKVTGGQVSFSGCTFSDNTIHALYIDSATTTLNGNLFQNNGWVNTTLEWWKQSPYGPLTVRNSVPISQQNQFENNALNGLDWSGQINGHNQLDNILDWPWISNGFTVGAGSELTIVSGSRFKMKDLALVTIQGALQAQGLAEKPIIFTSFRDDSDGYDSNGDGASSTPRSDALEWYQLRFDNAATSSLDYLIVRYANQQKMSADPEGSVYVNQTPLTARHLLIEYSRQPGTALQLKNSRDVEIRESLIKNYSKPANFNWETVGILIDGGAPAVQATIDTFRRGLKTKNSPDLSKMELQFVNVDIP